jgi:nucleoside recognition membrane protein YjiH
MVESPIIVDAESVDMVPSVVVVVSVSVFFELQEVARAIMAMKKKADFVIAFIVLERFCLSD